MSPREEEEFELVLGNKQLLSLFFLVVVLFGVFFSFGYTVGYSRGENSRTRQVASAEPVEEPAKKVQLPETLLHEAPKPTGPTTPSTAAAAPTSGGEPPAPEASAAAKKEPAPTTVAQNNTAAKEAPKPRPVQQEPPKPTPPPVAKTSQPPATKTSQPPAAKTSAPPKTVAPAKTAAAKPAGQAQPASGRDITRSTHLQIAAVRVKQDADLFVQQLKAKGHPAAVSDLGDGWYRVVVGPFGSEAEAQAYQKRLSQEGVQSLLRKR